MLRIFVQVSHHAPLARFSVGGKAGSSQGLPELGYRLARNLDFISVFPSCSTSLPLLPFNLPKEGKEKEEGNLSRKVVRRRNGQLR